MKPSYFVLPASFDPGEFLPRYLQNRHDDARYLLSTIVKGLTNHRADDRGCVRLQFDYLRNVMAAHDCTDVVQALIEGGAIERHPYVVGVRSYGYRLGSRFLADTFVRVEVTDRRLLGRLESNRRKHEARQQKLRMPIHDLLCQNQTHLEIHGEAARRVLDGLKPMGKIGQRFLIETIEQKDWRLSVSQYGRVFNNITGLNSDVRRQLHVKGERLECRDICNAQPAFLGQAFVHQSKCTDNGGNGLQSDHPPLYGGQEVFSANDVSTAKYLELVQGGTFNVFFEAELNRRGIAVANPKKRFLVDVLARKSYYPSPVEDLFRDEFPVVWQFIKDFNRGNHAALIRELQRMEAAFVVGVVCQGLAQHWPDVWFLTLHDAVYARERDMARIEAALQAGCDQVGFQLKWKKG